MASSLSFDDSDELYWLVPLAKLNSTIISEIAKAKEEIHQLLLSDSRDNNAVLGDLFNLYVSANSSAASEILVEQSRQDHVIFLFEKMNDSLKYSEKKYPTLMLLWNIIQREPSWLHTIISTAFFNSFIKCLKGDNDVVILMTGILIITSLLPSIPSLVGSFLVDFFEIFERAFLFTARKRGFIPDTHLLHLQVAVHAFFHRLYAMYPNNTLTFMKSFYVANHDEEAIQAVESLIRWVKFHPWLIVETTLTETNNLRWRSKEPHDVTTDCEKLSLDPNDCLLQESETLSLGCRSRQSFSSGNPSDSSGILTSSDNSVQQAAHDEDRLDTATQTGTSLQNAPYNPRILSFDSGTVMLNSTPLIASSAMCCSPTTLCSLSTPPHSQDGSPMGSTLDVSVSGNIYSNRSPSFSSSNISNLELPVNDVKTAPSTPNKCTRRFHFDATHQNSQCCVLEIVGDSTVSERSTSPVGVNTGDTGKLKEISLNVSQEKKRKCSSDGKDGGTERSSGAMEKDLKAKSPGEMLELLLPFTYCIHCMEDGPKNPSKVKLDWEGQMSPVQLLDQYLKFGKSLQEKRLDRIPLTCQEGTEWTHFGGCPPADEITLLHNELLLLQSEVLFERHKCIQHATRNRRLVGKVFQTNAVKEESMAIKDQMKLLETEMTSLEQALKEKLTENRNFKEKTESCYLQQQNTISNLSRMNETLAVEKGELDGNVKTLQAENKKLQVELKETKARISHLENDMSRLRRLENENGLLKSQSDMQAKNLLIMGEREERLKDFICVLKLTVKDSPENETETLIFQKELEASHTLVNEQKTDLVYLRSQISEMESSLIQKDHQIKDLKKSIVNIKASWKDKLEVVESKYQTIKRANQRLESEVMSLHSKLGARTRDR